MAEIDGLRTSEPAVDHVQPTQIVLGHALGQRPRGPCLRQGVSLDTSDSVNKA